MKIKQLISYPNPNELGLGNTNETYIRVENGLDVSDIFPPLQEIEVTDRTSNKSYFLKAKDDREFRINQLGPIYRDYHVSPGDEIKFTQIDNGKKTVLFTVTNYNRVYLSVTAKGTEIVNIERLNIFSNKEKEFTLKISEGTLKISFDKSERKRSDSPIETEFYKTTVNGVEIEKGSYYITIKDGKNVLEEVLKNKVEEYAIDDSNGSSTPKDYALPLQQIYYGTPGSGKSHKVDEIYQANKNNGTCFRTIFHPDSDYSTFVGCYKPISKKESLLGCKNLTENEILDCFFDSKDETKYPNAIKARYWYEALKNREDIKNLGLTPTSIASKLTSKGFDKTAYTSEVSCIFSIFDWLKNDGYLSNTSLSYEFVPQVFTDAYVKAWEDTSVPVYLIIEEINRGNCAQVFGDLFQLLDRTNGVSDYPINADHDLRAYLEEKLGEGHEGIKDGKLKLPANLNILATMNTSDQSLFPMDSAFKRRWEWEYVPINYSDKDDDGKPLDSYNFTITFGGNKYRWIDFLKKVNNKIKDVTKSEDKQMGNFFIKHDVDEKEFCNKVMFYLWNDVAKDYYESNDNLFQTKENHEDENGKSTKHFSYNELFGENCTKLLEGFFKMLDVKQFEEAGLDDGVPGSDDGVPGGDD